MKIKHTFEVTGVLSNGEKFIGGCVAYDILNAIQIFKDEGYSIHTVNNRVQTHADSEIGITYIQPCLYPVVKSMPLTELTVAQKMYELFQRDDYENFCKVRKQILKNQIIDYFQKK